MWTYRQRSGALLNPAGVRIAVGYAGYADHKNQPESERYKNLGPLPRGLYRMLAPVTSQRTGPYTLRLIPDKTTQMYGRSGMAIHGDSKKFPGTASNGCIILPRTIRETIWKSGDKGLMVIE